MVFGLGDLIAKAMELGIPEGREPATGRAAGGG
jgi:hypothetical protein